MPVSRILPLGSGLVFILIATSCVRQLGQPSTLREQLTGQWQVAVLEDRIDGTWVQSFGPDPQGYLEFAVNGRMSVQIQRGNLGPGKSTAGLDERYIAYFGRYTVDEQRKVFATIVEGSIDPAIIGTTQTRDFAIDQDGKRLTVQVQNRFRRVFYRIP